MNQLIYVLCMMLVITSCVPKKKFTFAENGRLAALSLSLIHI